MMWICSNDDFDCIAKFDPQTGSLEKYSATALNQDAPQSTEIAGNFSEVKHARFVLYRSENQIIFRVDDAEFVLDGRTIIDVSKCQSIRQMAIQREGALIFEFKYELMRDDSIPNDPTPFVSDEDFDFGLLASNISKSAERRDVMLGKR